MKRLQRWIWRTGILLSSLLFVATVFLWIRSYWTSDLITATRFRSWQVESNHGLLDCSMLVAYPIGNSLVTSNVPKALAANWQLHYGTLQANAGDLPETFLGFGALQSSGDLVELGTPVVTHHTEEHDLYVPIWSIALLTFLAPAWCIFKWTRRGFAPDLCPQCGYDLRATSDRCPECGKEFEPRRREEREENKS
jgi:hypothetical protein